MLNNTILYHNESNTHSTTYNKAAQTFHFNTQTAFKPIQISMRSSIKKKRGRFNNIETSSLSIRITDSD